MTLSREAPRIMKSTVLAAAWSPFEGISASDAIRAGSLLQEAQSYMTGGVIGAIFSIALFIVGGTLISKSKKALQETNT